MRIIMGLGDSKIVTIIANFMRRCKRVSGIFVERSNACEHRYN